MSSAQSKYAALEELIRSMFSDAELRSFIHRLPDAERLVASLPGGAASQLQVVFDVIGLLNRHGVIDREFFEALARERPRKRARIAEVAETWGVKMGSTSTTPSASPLSSAPPHNSSAPASSPPASPKRWDVFVSYAHEDQPWVRVLAENLHQLGLEVFYDEWEVDYGDAVTRRLDEGLRRSRNGVLVISPTAVSRPWVLEEYAALLAGAVQRGQRLIPVLYRDAEMPPMLSNRRWVDLRSKTGDDYLEAVRQLAAALRGERPQRPARGQGLRVPGAPVGDAPPRDGVTSSPTDSPPWEEYVPPQDSDGKFPVSRLGTMWGSVMREADARGLQLAGQPYKGNDHAYSSESAGLRQVQVRALRAPSASPVVQDGLDGPSVEVSFAGSAVPLIGSSEGTEERMRYVAGATRGSARHKGEVRLRVVVLLDGWGAAANDATREELLAEAFRAAVAVFERSTGFSLSG